MIGVLALCRVSERAIVFITSLNFVEIRLLIGVVCGAKLLCSLEHQMLQVVCQACSFGRIIARSRADYNVGLQSRLLFVDTHVDFQAVVKGVDARLHRVTFDGREVVVFGRN